MVWDWNNPIGLGLFFLMCAATVALLSFSAWLVSRVATALPRRTGNGRR
jgi:hypothetical protein